MTITLHLEKLRFFARHGLHEEEKRLGNEFELGITIAFEASADVIAHLNETIDYAAVYELAKAEMLQPRELLETFLTQLAGKIKAQFPRIKKLSMVLYKLNMPITNFEGRVGVQIEKEYTDVGQ